MRLPPRLTRSRSSVTLSPPTPERPHPTVAHTSLPPRRRLRDGTSSRGSSATLSPSSRASKGLRKHSLSRKDRTAPTSAVRRQPAVPDGSKLGLSDPEADGQTFERLTPSAREVPVRSPGPTSMAERCDLLALLDEVVTADGTPPTHMVSNHIHVRPTDKPFPLERTDSGSGSTSTSTITSGASSAARRYTTQEKGKGRAVIISPIRVPDDEVGGDESIELIGVRSAKKRRRGSEEVVAQIGGAGLGEDEERGLGSFTCPVCFCAPIHAVMTLCGHILCAKCLLDSLTAAIKRNPNPHPIRQPPGTRGRGRGRGRGGGGIRNLQATGRATGGGPTEWSAEMLRAAWFQYLDKRYETRLAERGVEEESWKTFKETDMDAPREDSLVVKEELKGFWTIDGREWVIEGECPVCRKAIPGGFAPPKSGLGGVIPLAVRVGGGDVPNGRRKRG